MFSRLVKRLLLLGAVLALIASAGPAAYRAFSLLACDLSFGTHVVTRLDEVSHFSRVQFPPRARLLAGTHTGGLHSSLVAVVEIPNDALEAFLAQSTVELLTYPQGPTLEIEWLQAPEAVKERLRERPASLSVSGMVGRNDVLLSVHPAEPDAALVLVRWLNP